MLFYIKGCSPLVVYPQQDGVLFFLGAHCGQVPLLVPQDRNPRHWGPQHSGLATVSWSTTPLSQVLALGMLVYYGELLGSGLFDIFEKKEQEPLETGNLKLSCFQQWFTCTFVQLSL